LNSKAEIIRIQYKYRQIILRGKTRLHHSDAAQLIGPDSAYHLYSTYTGREKEKKQENK
jgi:hypothetical protein